MRNILDLGWFRQLEKIYQELLPPPPTVRGEQVTIQNRGMSPRFELEVRLTYSRSPQ